MTALLKSSGTFSGSALDSEVYDPVQEYNAYADYVAADGGTIQDATATQEAIRKAIEGNYYSGLGFAVSARWGHKNLGAVGQTLYSLNRIKNDQSGTSEFVLLDTLSFAYAVAKFNGAATLAWLQFDGMALRHGATLGCVVLDKAADTSSANGIGVKWTDGAIHYFWPAGAIVNGEEVLKNGPNYTTDNLKVGHFALDCDEKAGIGGQDGTELYPTAYFANTIAQGETADLRITAIGGSNRLLAEMWFFNGASVEAIRQCGADVGARY